MSAAIQQQIERRRTFAIISHPDAGKTTLTEKFLPFGGAIQTAGAVKNNKITKTAASDFMEIERQRGISVATSVMAFRYKDLLINLLDTPGHRDFAEDTYRTLTAVDTWEGGEQYAGVGLDLDDAAHAGDVVEARSILHWSPYDRVRVVNADP